MNTRDKNFRYTPTLLTSPFLVLGFSLLFILVQVLLQSGPVDAAPFNQFLRPWIVLANIIPIFLTLTFILCLTRRLWLGVLTVSLPYVVILCINHFKIIYRQEPFSPADLTLVGETSDMLERYTLTPDIWVISGVLLALFMIVGAAIFFRPAKLKPLPRVLGALLCAVLALCSTTLYRDKALYSKLSAPNKALSSVGLSAGNGFLFTFLTDISAFHYQKPDGYSPETAEAILSRYDGEDAVDPATTPNVIAIMSEAFFDPSDAENLEFLPGRDPLVNYRRILSESYHGKIVVPGFAGGTAVTESEFLTGINTTVVSRTLPTIYTHYIKQKTQSLPMLFSRSGYTVNAIHPGHPWFYNRQNVYPCFGFESFTTKDNLPSDVEQVHYYVSDRVTTDLIIDQYDTYLNNPQKDGYFNFTVTIQNHGPYAEQITDHEPRLVRPEGISDELYAILNNYTEGLSDADQMLLRLTEYLNTVDEPTVLVFFGDHLPFFGSEAEGFRALGFDVDPSTEEGLLHRHQTPYLIWQNAAAKAQNPNFKAGQGPTISASFLSTVLLEQMNVPLTPYHQFLKDLQQKVQVIAPTFYMKDGEITHTLDDATQKQIDEYRILQYYHIFDWCDKQ